MKTIKKACNIPATPTIHDKRINRIYTKDFLDFRKEHAHERTHFAWL